LQPLYPAVDIPAECRKMAGWLIGNPGKRKTPRGIKRFVTGWLAKEQDRGGSRNRGGSATSFSHENGNNGNNGGFKYAEL
jgi:hypothetical protein